MVYNQSSSANSHADICIQVPSLGYRVTDDRMATLRAILQRYEGSHKFHNFTSGVRVVGASNHDTALLACLL
jgi:tRNA U38,U39,U40 pseudouridine synthase TruA